MLALWCAVLAVGFTIPEARERAWSVVGVATLVALAVTAPSSSTPCAEPRAGVAARAGRRRARSHPRGSAVQAALTRCGGRLTVPDARPRPLAAYLLGRAPKTIGVARPARPA